MQKIFYYFTVFILLIGCKISKNSQAKPNDNQIKTSSRFKLNDISGNKILDNSTLLFSLNASEPHVYINPKNPANIVGGSILDNVYFTTDTGKTWQKQKLKSSFGVYGDPVLIADKQGHFYYFHLSPGKAKNGYFLDRIVVQKSTDGGKTWSDGKGIGYNPPKQQDKPWPAYDPEKNLLAVAWTEFDKYGSKAPEHKSRILISISRDGGTTWTKPVKINDTDGDCLDDDNTVEGAVPVFDEKGNIYVVWAYNGKLWLDYSTDFGKTWHQDRIIGTQKAGWTFDIQGIYRTNGLPNFKRDAKTGFFYVVYGDYDEKTGGDVYYIMSKDQTKTWSAPKKIPVNDKNDQFFPTMDVQDGKIWVAYYDRSNMQNDSTEIKLSVFNSEMIKLHEAKLSEKPFKPVKRLFFGDYIGLDVHKNIISIFWTEVNPKKQLELHAKTLKYEENQ